MMRRFGCNRAAAVFVGGWSALLAGCATYGDFRLSTLEGKEMSLAEQEGKVVLVAFWAST